MKSLACSMFFLLMLCVAAQGFAGEALQMWSCEVDDEADEEMVEAHALNWLTAAKTLDGGANIEARLLWPVVVNATSEADVWFLITMPSFAEWGKFWDAYPDSEAADIEEDAIEILVCPDSVVWESHAPKPE